MRIKTAILSGLQSTTTYDDVAEYKTVGLGLLDSGDEDKREILRLIDPLIAPVLGPFVEGIERPFNDSLADFKGTLARYWVVSVAGSFLLGAAAGSLYRRSSPSSP